MSALADAYKEASGALALASLDSFTTETMARRTVDAFLAHLADRLPTEMVLSAAQAGYSPREWDDLGREQQGEECASAENMLYEALRSIGSKA